MAKTKLSFLFFHLFKINDHAAIWHRILIMLRVCLNNYHRHGLFLFLLIQVVLLPAQSNKYNFGHLTYADGLSHNLVLSTLKDNNGFIWFGTMSGLNRYDGYSFKTFKSNPFDANSLPDNLVGLLTLDQKNRIWIGLPNRYVIFNPSDETFDNTYSFKLNETTFSLSNISKVLTLGDSLVVLLNQATGLIKHNIYTKESSLIESNNESARSILSDAITDFTFDREHRLWLIRSSGLIERFNNNLDKVTKQYTLINSMYKEPDAQYRIYLDQEGEVWVYSKNEAKGIIRITPSTQQVMHLFTESEPVRLNSNIITDVVQDSEGKIWIGTDHGGLDILDKVRLKVTYLQNTPDDENSLSQNVITSLYRDNEDIIWVTTFKQGVNYYHKNLFRFNHIMHHASDEQSLPYNDVNCFSEDNQGNLWIGTNGYGLIYYNRQLQTFTTYKNNPNDSNSLSNNVIVSLYTDKTNQLWIGTYYGGLCVFDGKKFKTYLHDPTNPKSIADDRVWEIFEDTHANIWIGMLGGGLDLFNRKTEQFQHFSGSDFASVQSTFVMDLDEDSSGNIWTATEFGIFILERQSGRFKHYGHDNDSPNSLSSNFVYNVFKDSRNLMWAGTRDGLNLFDATNNSFKNFRIEDGLADNTILSILESNEGNLWVSTSNGLSCITIHHDPINRKTNFFITNYNESDGLQGREFNEGSACKTRKGELIFGGSNGFNLFMPKDIRQEDSVLKTYILNLEVFGKPVKVNEYMNGRTVVDQSILNNKQLKLRYKENIFSLEFASINMLHAKKIRYRYKLEGFNDQWIYNDWKVRKATYTNLSPGKYTFLVQASESDQNWKLSQASLNILIKPPFYRTYVAYVAYYLFIFGILLLFRRSLIQRERLKFQNQQAVQETLRQQEISALKTRFFTNVSHEFRTPLTLIITPLEKLLKTELNEDSKKQLNLMYQNARRLLNLVNQLLDFRKIEEKRIKLNLDYGNVITSVEQAVLSFSDLKESKGIELSFKRTAREIFMQFDHDKLEKIIFNLLSNAFKFTPEGGKILVETYLGESLNEKQQLIIKVSDNGIGIPPEKHEKIFERFFQDDLPSGMMSKGSGVGLSLTKDFIELMGGTIRVESEEGKGSCFTIHIPVENAENTKEEESGKDVLTLYQKPTEQPEPAQHNKFPFSILLVEDNDDFRFYLRDNLIKNYQIFEAANGVKALEVIESKHPDLVVSDVMMPEMDGFELCRTIKTQAHISHIPVILLTARSSETDMIDGYKTGADEYIVKPFSFEILESRINYLITRRQQFIESYQQSFQIQPATEGITSLDEKLLQKTLAFIEENLASDVLSVEKLSSELGISRVHLYKKLLNLTGKSPVEFIRFVRLKKAADLLTNSSLTISEIAYQVGFSDPRYFSKQFKVEFNTLPTRFRDGKQKKG